MDPRAARDAGLDPVELLIAAIDEEKDPRCLLLALEAVRKLCDTWGGVPDDLAGGWDEVWDILACYFPVGFTPADDGAVRVTREDILAGLVAAMTCHRAFAGPAVKLAVEKLGSTLQHVSLDAVGSTGKISWCRGVAC